jgi:hypothetical protein
MATIAMRKVTVLLPKDLVDRAMKATGQGLTPTIKRGLEQVSAEWAFQYLLQRRGKVKLSLDVDALRED